MWVLQSRGDEARGAQVPAGRRMGNLHGFLLAQRGPATLSPVATGPAPGNFSSSLCFYLQDVGRHPGFSGFAQSAQSDVASSPTFQSWSTEPLMGPPTSLLPSPWDRGAPKRGRLYRAHLRLQPLGSLSIHHSRTGPLPECCPRLASRGQHEKWH